MKFEVEYRPIIPNDKFKPEWSATPDKPKQPRVNIVRKKHDIYADSWKRQNNV